MADNLDPFSLNVEGVSQLISSNKNKHGSGISDNPEGVESEKFDALDLPMTDAELLKLRDEYEMRYAPYEGKLKPRVAKIRESYLGERADGQWLVDQGVKPANQQFLALETYLSAALSKNPEPVVWADSTPEGEAIATAVKTMLQFHADQLVMRRKLAFMVRQHSTDLLGVLKPGWNSKINDVALDNRKVRDYIFDPNGYVDAYGDFTSWYGERITVSAEKLIEEFPKHKTYIELECDGKLGTEVVYTEWWPTDEYCFYSFKEIILDKHKNQYFKYPEPTGEVDPITGEEIMSEPINHFAHPKKPGIFLSIYSMHEQPHDVTSLVEQNIPNQARITRITEQIDFNIASGNNGYAFSEDNFNQETGKQAANARRKGNPILIPSGGPIQNAILPLPAQSLPGEYFSELENAKNDLRDSWGIQGIASQQQDEDQTVRGMIINQSQDTSRIGGSIGQSIEQVADNAFNWMVQLYTVFYDEPHFAAIMGSAKAVEYVELSTQDFNRQLIVSVAPDSMIPKDEINQSNMAQSLFDKKAIGPLTLLKMLSFPDPDNAASDGVLYAIDPATYMQIHWPDLMQQIQQAQQQKAEQEMQNAAQGAGMSAAAEAQATPPEATTEPAPEVSKDAASTSLGQIQMPKISPSQ